MKKLRSILAGICCIQLLASSPILANDVCSNATFMVHFDEDFSETIRNLQENMLHKVDPVTKNDQDDVGNTPPVDAPAETEAPARVQKASYLDWIVIFSGLAFLVLEF